MLKIDSNNKRLYSNIIGAFTVKGLGLVINFFTIPMYMRYFAEYSVLGVWYTILSILTWILTFDLGIGNGLRNHIVEPLLKNDKKKLKQLLSSAYLALGAFSLLILIGGIICVCCLNWNSIFNISENVIPLHYLRIAFSISIIGLSFQFFLKLVLSILNAMEKTALSNAVMLVSNIINFLYLFIGTSGDDISKLIILSIVYSLSVNVPLLICTIIIFATTLKGCLPRASSFGMYYAKQILGLGGSFFAIQILFMIITSTNEFFISNIFGAENVVEFQVYNKVFYTFVTLYSLITNPIWSAVTRAWKEGRFEWIKDVYKKMMITACFGVIGVLALSMVFQPVVDLWLGQNTILVTKENTITFAAYVIVMFFVFAVNSIANGLQSLKPQIIWFSISVLVKCIICFVFKDVLLSWNFVIWINTITLIPYVLFQMIDLNKKIEALQKGL